MTTLLQLGVFVALRNQCRNCEIKVVMTTQHSLLLLERWRYRNWNPRGNHMRLIERYHWPIGTCLASIRHRCDTVCQYWPSEVLERPTREVTNTVNTAPFGAFLWKFQVNFSSLLYHRLSSSHRLWRTLFSFNSAFLSDGYFVLNLSFHLTAFEACFWPLFASVGLIKLISNSSRQEHFLKSFARYAQRFSNRTLRLCWSLILPRYVTKINQISLNCGLL